MLRSTGATKYAVASVGCSLGQLADARRDLAAATRLDPRNARIWSEQSELLLRLGQVTEARASAERRLALPPNSLHAIQTRSRRA